MIQPSIPEITLTVEAATSERVAPFGQLVGMGAGTALFAEWPGTQVLGPVPFAVEVEGELLVVQSAAKAFPHQVALIERHFLHTQTYLPLNAKPFVMVLGAETDAGLPVIESLCALAFAPGVGIVLDKGVWHDFPYSLEDDTQFAVLLSATAHLNTLQDKAYPMDAEGPDLERRSLRERASIWVTR